MERLVQSRINILNDCSTPIPQVNDGGGGGQLQVSLLKELEMFNLETVDEKVRLIEKCKVFEDQNGQMQRDLETLIFRIEELEVQNQKIKSDA